MNPRRGFGNANIAAIHHADHRMRAQRAQHVRCKNRLAFTKRCPARLGLLSMRSAPMSCDAARLVNNQVIFRLVAGNLDERGQTLVFRMNS
jgi:hypothetical protein